MRFSERIGKRAPKDIIQVDSMDEGLRNGLWNVVLILILNPLQKPYETNYSISFSEGYTSLISNIWIEFLKQPVDEMPDTFGYARYIFKNIFMNDDYLEVL